MGAAAMVFGRTRLFLLLGVALVFLGGCQTTHYFKSERLGRPDENRRILLMPVDVELSELSAAGSPKPHAAWTRQATEHIDKALRDFFGQRQTELTHYKSGPKDDDLTSTRVQLVKLHGVVGGTAMTHQLVPAYRLPNKENNFDWTLGPAVQELKREYGADYALFMRIRDSYATGERVAFIIAAALLGVAVPGGQQIGFATLVDLEDGDIVWFNFLFRDHGDLRTYKPAEETVKALFTQFPK